MAGHFMKIDMELAARKDLKPADKLVLGYLRYRIGTNTDCWPGTRKIAEDLGLHRLTALKIVTRLANLGELIIVKQDNGQVNHYQMPAKSGSQTQPLSGGVVLPKATGNEKLPVVKRNTPGSQKQPEAVAKRNQKRTEENKEKKHPAKREGDAHAEAFKKAFDEAFPEVGGYHWPKHDFIQLAAWKKQHPNIGPESFVDVAVRHWGRGGFCPGAAKGIAGLCTKWSQLASWKDSAPAPVNEERDNEANPRCRRPDEDCLPMSAEKYAEIMGTPQ